VGVCGLLTWDLTTTKLYKGWLSKVPFHPLDKSKMSSEDIHTAPRKTSPESQGSDSKLDLGRDRKQAELAHLEKAVVDKETQFVVRD